MFYGDTTTIVFYNDNPKNLERDITKDAANSTAYNNVVLVAASFVQGKALERKLVIDLSDENYLAISDWITLIADQTVLVPLQKIKGLGGLADKSRWAIVKIQ